MSALTPIRTARRNNVPRSEPVVAGVNTGPDVMSTFNLRSGRLDRRLARTPRLRGTRRCCPHQRGVRRPRLLRSGVGNIHWGADQLSAAKIAAASAFKSAVSTPPELDPLL